MMEVKVVNSPGAQQVLDLVAQNNTLRAEVARLKERERYLVAAALWAGQDYNISCPDDTQHVFAARLAICRSEEARGHMLRRRQWMHKADACLAALKDAGDE